MPRTNLCKSPELVAIEKDLREWLKSNAKSESCAQYLSATQVGKYIGLRETAATKWLTDVEYVLFNNRRRYKVESIAQKIYQYTNFNE